MEPEITRTTLTMKHPVSNGVIAVNEFLLGENLAKKEKFRKVMAVTSTILNHCRRAVQITGLIYVPSHPMIIEQRVIVQNEMLSAMWRTKGND